MKKIKILLSLILITLAFISCDPSDSNSNSNDNFSENFGSAVNRSFIGQVVDTDNLPIQNATVKIGTSTVQTDVNGVFIINDASVHEKFAYITVKKAGYVDGSRSLIPTTGKNNVKIMLLSILPTQTVDSGIASEVSISSGTKVNFDGAFQDENGNAYSGSVRVTMFHLTSSDENLESLMPGMLYAENKNGNEVMLQTFGMLNVKLRGSGGEILNLADGHTAQITMKIDDSQLAIAPNTIPLWHFDEEVGYWKEDGVATKTGSYYVGTVSHFSWWNCDTFSNTVSLTVTVVDNNGNPLSNVGVELIVNATGINSYTLFTNENGQVAGNIPTDLAMTLNLVSECGVVYTTTIGPFSSDTILPITLNSSSSVNSTQVKGKLLKCNNTIVTNGYIMLNMNGKELLSAVTNGDFSFNVAYCSGNTAFALDGVDYDSFQRSGKISYNFQSTKTDVGELLACNSVGEFVLFKYDNEPQNIILSNFNSGFQTLIPNYFITANEGLYSLAGVQLYTSSILPGTYSGSDSVAYIAIRKPAINNVGEGFSASTSSITINKYGNIGEYIDMTFIGTGTDGAGVSHTVTGVVHIKRVN